MEKATGESSLVPPEERPRTRTTTTTRTIGQTLNRYSCLATIVHVPPGQKPCAHRSTSHYPGAYGLQTRAKFFGPFAAIEHSKLPLTSCHSRLRPGPGA